MRTFKPRNLAALLCTLGCSEPTGATGDSVATYRLESVDGCAPGLEAGQCFPTPSWVTGGTMVLADDGRVTRTMTYQFPVDASPVTQVATGSYFRLGGFVALALRQDAGGTPYIWRPQAMLSDEVLTLRYPRAADGETVEVFRLR